MCVTKCRRQCECDLRPTIIVVLPGSVHRRPVLERICEVARVCVLLPSSSLQRSIWAKEVVGEANWIEWEGELTDANMAVLAVGNWLEVEAVPCVDGIMTYDDFAVELTANLCEHFKKPGTPVTTIQMLQDKKQFRKQCADAGLPVVKSIKLHMEDDVDAALLESSLNFPAVLKPVRGGGSWYLTVVHTPAELLQVWHEFSTRMEEGAFPKEIRDAGFILEEYFVGHEVDVDGWARDGKIEFCVVADNRPAIEPFFLEVGGIYPSQLPSNAVEALEKLTAQVVAAFPGVHTCFHFEAKINMDTFEVMPIEFNPRVGGAECPACVEAVTGYYLPCIAADLALGRECKPGRKQHKVVSSTNLHWFEAGVISECTDQFVDVAKLVTSVLRSDMIGKLHTPNNGSMSCLGFMGVGGESFDEAEYNLKLAINQTRIRFDQQTDSITPQILQADVLRNGMFLKEFARWSKM